MWHFNTKYVSFSITLQDEMWHSLLSLELGIVITIQFLLEVYGSWCGKVAIILHSSDVNGCFKYNPRSYLRKS